MPKNQIKLKENCSNCRHIKRYVKIYGNKAWCSSPSIGFRIINNPEISECLFWEAGDK